MSVFEDSYIKIEPNPNDVQEFSTLYTVTPKVENGSISYSLNYSSFTNAHEGVTPVMINNSCIFSLILFGYEPYEFIVTINKTADDSITILSNGTQVQKEKIELLSRGRFLYTVIEKIDDNKYLRY